MRIAVSGTHRVGKTTLIAALADRLPEYTVVDEPYRLLEEDGFEFSHPPSIDDFEAQLERSLKEVEESDVNTLFDRCPVDLLAYLIAHPDADGTQHPAWWSTVEEAMGAIELVVYVLLDEPDADPDRIAMDEALHELLSALDVPVVEVSGTLHERVELVRESLAPAHPLDPLPGGKGR